MFRFLFRFVGLILLAAAFILVVYDGTRSIAGNAVFFTTVRDAWAMVHVASLQAAQPAVEGSAPWLWAGIAPLLIAPSWLFFGVLGIVLLILGRKKKPLIGYAR